jgi:hypothetical protein
VISADVVVEGIVEGVFERTVRGVIGSVVEAVRIETKTSMWALQPRIVCTKPVASLSMPLYAACLVNRNVR